MRKNKKWLLFLVIAFPSAFWVILELSTINSKKLPFFGPKQANGKDTIYYELPPVSFYALNANRDPEKKLYDTVNYPILTLCIIKRSYAAEGYRLEGLLDYTQYKKNDIDKIPIVLLGEIGYSPTGSIISNVRDSLRITLPNIEQCYWPSASFDSLNVSFFKEKPIYVDRSFFVLIDKKRRVRGYYDGRYVAEVKRMIGEYRHLRIHEEKKNLVKENEIKTKANE